MREMVKRRNLSNRGFSLVELIIVIAIMAILAAVIAPMLIRYIDKSRKASDVETASVIYNAMSFSYNEAYSFEGDVGGVVQNADEPTNNNVSVSVNVGSNTDGPYDLEILSVSNPGGNGFTASIDQHQHFMDLIQQTLLQKNNAHDAFSKPKFKRDSGNGVPKGFLIGRRLDASGLAQDFEVWVTNSNGDPAYRLYPDCCDEYK